MTSTTRTTDARAMSPATEGLVYGFLGVLAFSFTLPLTRYAAPDLGGAFIGIGRALLAAVVALALVTMLREGPPPRRYWRSIALVAAGTVFGFGPMSSIAMQTLPAVHGAVVIGLLPAATAVMAVLRAGERPKPVFWLACGIGVVSVIVFAFAQGAGKPQWGDLWLLAAVVMASLGYAEGARISREIGGFRVVTWALVFSLPLLVIIVGAMTARNGIPQGSAADWMCFLYLGLISMYFGFLPWYRGLAAGGVAHVGQLQLVQPVLSMVWAAILLGETITLGTSLAAGLVIASAATTRLSRFSRPRTGGPP